MLDKSTNQLPFKSLMGISFVHILDFLSLPTIEYLVYSVLGCTLSNE